MFELTSGISSPTADQLNKINLFRPLGTSEYEASEISVITCRASHNLLQKDFCAWTPQSLLNMAKQYPGRPFELNHDWWDVAQTVAFVFDSMLLSVPEPDPECAEISPELNRIIASQFGCYELYLQVAVEAGSHVEEGVRYRRLYNVSTGGIAEPVLICPYCNIPYNDPQCPHIPNTAWTRYQIANGYLSKEQLASVAPFNLKGVQTLTEECSFVPSGNLPGAHVLDARYAKY